MTLLYTAVAVACINVFGIVCFAITGFGNGILYQLGWYICALVASVCSGSIVDAVAHITIGGMLYFPLQIFLLWKHVNWPLALELSFYLEIGLVAGTYVLVSFDSPWLLRSLGLMFFIVAVQKLGLEIPKDPTATPPVLEGRYVVDTREKRLTLIGLGLTSGVFGGLFATGGPPLMVFVAITHIQKDEWRSTVAFCYLVENVARFIYLILIRKVVNLETEYLIPIAMLVSSVVGLYIGNKIATRIDQVLFRRLILAILGGGSLMMLTSGFDTWLMATLMTIGVCIFVGYGGILFFIQDRHVRYQKVAKHCPETANGAAANVNGTGHHRIPGDDEDGLVEIELGATTLNAPSSNGGNVQGGAVDEDEEDDEETLATVPASHDHHLLAATEDYDVVV